MRVSRGAETILTPAVQGRKGRWVAEPRDRTRSSLDHLVGAQQHRMPATSGWAEFARRGNLMSYGPNLQQVFRRLGWYVDRVLKGTNPSELPVELPITIEHVVNLRAARAMGLVIPRSVLLGADEVIE